MRMRDGRMPGTEQMERAFEELDQVTKTGTAECIARTCQKNKESEKKKQGLSQMDEYWSGGHRCWFNM